MATANPRGFEAMCGILAGKFYQRPLTDRGEWQSQKLRKPEMATRELNHVVLELPIPGTITALQDMVHPNLPWAEDHFQERVGGKALNPPPSAEWWPYRVQGHKGHVDPDQQFSHTYPERFWPRMANAGGTTAEGRQIFVPHVGIRFEFGDLQDLVENMIANPWTRQAYLPVWFPEDLEAARLGQRVPCTIGYHFLRTEYGLDCTYHIRSCDFFRHFRDDVYMAMRLTQWVAEAVGESQLANLFMHISNFHTFAGDDPRLSSLVGTDPEVIGGHDGLNDW